MERERVGIPLAMARDLLKTQNESHPGKPQSNRQKPEIMNQAHQSRVLRSLQVLPLVQQHAGVALTQDPDGRATMGVSSSGGAAFGMAWFHPELYHRVLAYSPTLTNQQWPYADAMPGGAWQYHSPWAGNPAATVSSVRAALIPNAPRKPIRFWFEAGDRDLFYPAPAMSDGMHDWVLASENMARVLSAKGYNYQLVLSRNAGYVDGPTNEQTLPEALLWLWRDYTPQGG